MRILKMIFFPVVIWYYLWKTCLIYMPGDFGIKLRYYIYRGQFKSCGKRVYIDSGVQFKGKKFIQLGSDIHIDKNSIIYAGNNVTGHQKMIDNPKYIGGPGEIHIGDHTHIVQQCILMGFGGIQIGPRSTLSAGTKVYSQSNLAYNPKNKKEVVSIMPYDQAQFINGPVCLDENVWVGLNCVIMPGSSIGKNSFVVSYSLVKDQFGDNSYLAGQPSKKIRNRFEE
jgi:acetyltransferase-like isoleucine patch superfamily enzyme